MSDELSTWAEEVREETFQFWQDNYKHWEPGFQVWYGPVDSSKSVLILGIQPGGDADAFENKRSRFESGDFSLPTNHDYLNSDFDLARGMRKAVPEETINQSVKTNLNFFRAPEQTDWENGLDEESRKEMEEFSLIRVEELIDRLSPELVITEGTSSVYDKLQSRWGFPTKYEKMHEVGDNREERVVCVGEAEDFQVVGLKHPSSGRGLGEEEYEVMRETIIEVTS